MLFRSVQHGERLAGFAVEALHGYDSEGAQKLRLTVNRPVIYAEHKPFPANGDEGMADVGAFEQRIWLFDVCGKPADLPRLARERVFGAEHYEITAASDGAQFTRDIWTVEPAGVEVLSQRPGTGGMLFDLLNTRAETLEYCVTCNGEKVAAGLLKPHELTSAQIPF